MRLGIGINISFLCAVAADKNQNKLTESNGTCSKCNKMPLEAHFFVKRHCLDCAFRAKFADTADAIAFC